jgi:carbon monoxide dehydrogenase subunit G
VDRAQVGVLNPLRSLERGRSWHTIDYSHHFLLDASPSVAWSVLEDIDLLGGCSPWLQELTVDDPGMRDGATLHAIIATPLPFQVKIRLDLEEWVPFRLIVAAVNGDLKGKARLGLSPVGEISRVDLDWTVEIVSPPIRRMSHVAYPLLRWGHDRVIQSAIERLAARLCPVDDQSPP